MSVLRFSLWATDPSPRSRCLPPQGTGCNGSTATSSLRTRSQTRCAAACLKLQYPLCFKRFSAQSRSLMHASSPAPNMAVYRTIRKGRARSEAGGGRGSHAQQGDGGRDDGRPADGDRRDARCDHLLGAGAARRAPLRGSTRDTAIQTRHPSHTTTTKSCR